MTGDLRRPVLIDPGRHSGPASIGSGPVSLARIVASFRALTIAAADAAAAITEVMTGLPTPDEPGWPDAQRVRPGDYDDPDWTLGRIDRVLDLHQGEQR